MSKVTIIQRIVPHYRVPFFRLLQRCLTDHDIDFQLVYGQEYPGTVPASVVIDAPWAVRVTNRYIPGPGGMFVWQPAWSHLKDSNLVIVEQASAFLFNYILQLGRRLGTRKVAFWGQGINVRAKNPRSIPEQVKSVLLKQVDWWFAYTTHTFNIVKAHGFSTDRVTVVQNAIDNEEFRGAIDAVTASDVHKLKSLLRIDSGPVGLYCGAFIPPKRIDFLLEAAGLLKQRFPGLHVILMGSGPEEEKGYRAASRYPWIHYVGAKFDAERAVYFKASDVLLQPGTVGLVSVDSFVAGVPLYTTSLESHGPEITFIENKVNGWITENNLMAYVDSVSEYFQSRERQESLKNGCQASATIYTLDSMVNRFSEGIVRCLSIT